MTFLPTLPLQTINATQLVAANRSQVWETVRAMDKWSSFQSFFAVDLVGGEEEIQLDQLIRITSNFNPPQVTLEQIYQIDEEERICWTLRKFVVGSLAEIPTAPWLLRTARCIELFDAPRNDVMMHNWIKFSGILWPFVILFTGRSTRGLFEDFNSALAAQFSP